MTARDALGALRRRLDEGEGPGARASRTAWGATVRFFGDRCSLSAAAISYHVLFSLFPLAILLVSIFGLVMQDEERRQEVTDWLLDALPLSEAAGVDLSAAVEGLGTPFSLLGLFSLVGLLWSASGMMAAIRRTLAGVWGEERHSAVRGKALDFLLVLVAGLLVLVSFGLTIVARVVREVSGEAADSLGALDAVLSASGELTATLIPLALSYATFVFAYRFIPPVRPGYREALVGAVVATLGFELAKTGFAFYLAHFADYNVIYGSLGAVIAFLFLVYLVASIFLYGAEVAAQWPKAARPTGGLM